MGTVADRGAVYLAGMYRSVGRGWPSGYLLPDSRCSDLPAETAGGSAEAGLVDQVLGHSITYRIAIGPHPGP